MNRQDQIRKHLEFFAELGVDGVSRDHAWSGRQVGALDDVPVLVADAEDPGTERLRSRDSSLPDPSIDPARHLVRLREDLGECTRCKLHSTRTHLVYGVGNPGAELMFVGEAPGRDEDQQGIPFVGRAGQLLTKIIEAIGLRRDEVYIANVIKCRPPKNRNPELDEIETCQPFLFAQIDAIQPKVIVALGAFAVKTLLQREDAISRLRGRVFDYRGAKLVPTFHPAYLLRSPDKKRDVWEDMKTVRSMLREE